MTLIRTWALGLCAVLMAACSPTVRPVDEVVANLDDFLGEKVVVRTRLKSGARCRVGEEAGDFKAYCRDCQYCRGPVVVDVPGLEPSSAVDDWPLIISGTHRGSSIKCQGKLNEVTCEPFDLSKTYVIRGSIEKTRPPKLLVSDFWVD